MTIERLMIIEGTINLENKKCVFYVEIDFCCESLCWFIAVL